MDRLPRPTGPTWPRRLAVLIPAVLVVLATLASPAEAETTLEVTTPADGRFEPGQPTPLIVTIAADGAISGSLTATFEGFFAGSQAVEVPGGSTKEIVFIVTVPPWASSGSIAFVDDDGNESASGRIALTANRNDELIAVMGELASRNLPATAELDVEIGQARLYPLDPALLDAGPDVLSPFSQLVTTATDLRALGPIQLSAIESWVGGNGGTLVVDEDPGTPLPFDIDIEPNADAFHLGVGAVRFSSGQAGTGDYDGLFSPTPSRSSDQFPWGSGFGGAPTTPALARDAGVSVPPIGSLILLLLAYVAVAGPLLWVMLKRARRQPLLWVALPAIAVVATLSVYGVGRALRNSTSTAHATIIADFPNLRSVSTQVLVTSPNGGTEGIELREGWRPVSSFSEEMFFEGPFGGSSTQGSNATLVGRNLVADLPPGGVGVLAAEATMAATADRAWQIDLRDDDGILTGTVTNLTAHDLEEVLIASGQGFQRLQKVEAGQSVEIKLRDTSVPPMGRDRLIEQLWGRDPWGSETDDGAVNPGILIDWLGRRPLLRTPGFVVVVGWTRDEVGPVVTTRGKPIDSGRTAFLSTVRLDDDVLAGEPYRLELLRGWHSDRVIDAPGECAESAITLRMVTTEAMVSPDAVLDLSTRGIAAMDLWDGDVWQPAGLRSAPEQRVIMDIPEAALADGKLYLRVLLNCEFWNLANPFPDLRLATSNDDVLPFGDLDGKDDVDA